MTNVTSLGDLFGKAVADHLPPLIERKAQISECKNFRWTLSRYWNAPESGKRRIVLWIMCNPSTADGISDDPTLNEVIRRSRSWGFDGAEVVNLFPLRSPHPRDVREWLRELDEQQGSCFRALNQNWMIVARMMIKADFIVAAWGSQDFISDHVDNFLDEVGSEAARLRRNTDLFSDLHCLGWTANGSPKHPLARGVHRIPRDQQPILWRRI